MTKDEAMKLALEALEEPHPGVRTDFTDALKYREKVKQAIAALREALAEQPAQQEPVVCIIGTRGGAFDSPITKRAYTYKEQPGNAVASKLGRACNEAGKQRAGDNIDRGLGLLQELQNEGFGVFALGAEYTVTQQEPAAFEEWLAKQHGDPEEIGFLQALRIAYIAGQDSITSPPQRKPLMDVIKAAQGVLEWTEIAHRPPKRDRLEAGRMVMVRLHALADLHDALIAHGIKENT